MRESIVISVSFGLVLLLGLAHKIDSVIRLYPALILRGGVKKCKIWRQFSTPVALEQT